MVSYSGRLRKLFVYVLVILMLGIFGMLNATSEAPPQDVKQNSTEDVQRTRSIEPRSTTIGKYLTLTYSSGQVHDGNYGDGDGYHFFLNTQHWGFRIYLKNIDYDDYYIDQTNTTLKRGAGVGSEITITQPYYNISSNIYPGNVRFFDYNLEIGTFAKIDKYQLVINVEFTVFDENDQYVDRAGKIYIYLHLESRMRTGYGGEKITLEATDKDYNYEEFYSGAKNQLIRIPYVYSQSSTLYDVTFTLDLPSSFELASEEASISQLDVGTYVDDPLWRLDSAGAIDAVPQDIVGLFDVTYHINTIAHTETDLLITLKIEKTPIVNIHNQIDETDIGTMSGDKYISNLEIYQGTTTETFPITFTNEGNIDLKDVEVELYTENAVYFFKSNFYYDENANSYKRPYGTTVELGDVSTGVSVTRQFSTEVIKNLPPGLYRIPLRYSAKYVQGIFDVNFNVFEYHDDIMAARDIYNQGFTPFILVYVKEGDDENDMTEPDLLASSGTYLKPGMRSVKVSVELINLEYYQLNNVNADIDVGYPSPLQLLDEQNRTPRKVNALERDFIINATSKFTVNFLVDVYNDAISGVYEVPITIYCLDPFNQERTTTVNVPLTINPIPPEFIISEMTTTNIVPNSNFTLRVKVYNCGGADAEKVMMMFNGSSTLFSAVENVQGPQYIMKDNEWEYTFQLRAGEVEPGATYTASVLMSYEDPAGNSYPFDSNTRLSIPLYVKKPEPPKLPKFIVTDVSTKDIKPNANFTLAIKIYNAGESSGTNVRVMFNGSSNLFSARGSIQGPKFILKSEEAQYDFIIETGEIEPGKTYFTSICISYEDSDGNLHPFDQSNEHLIELHAKEEVIEPEVIIKEVKDETFEIDLGVAVVLLGLFILISVLLFAIIRVKTGKKGMIEEPGEESRIAPGPGQQTQEMRRIGKDDRVESNIIDMRDTEVPEQQYVPPPQANSGPYPPPPVPPSGQPGWQGEGTAPSALQAPPPAPPRQYPPQAKPSGEQYY